MNFPSVVAKIQTSLFQNSLSMIVMNLKKMTQNFDPNKAHGYDTMSIRLLKRCGKSIFKSLDLIFKQSCIS